MPVHAEHIAEKMLAIYTESIFDACWHLFLDWDLRARVLIRGSQKMALARYGRIPVGYWEGRQVTEIDHAIHDLSEVISHEDVGGVEDL